MTEFGEVWEEADRRYQTALTPRVRKCTVTAAASPFSYSLDLPGEAGADRAGVPSISPIVPIVGDLVRVELVADEPCIVGVYGRGPIRQQDGTAGTAGTSSTSYITSGSTGDVITQDMVAGQQVWVTVRARAWCSPSGSGLAARMTFKVTGADTYGPNDEDGVEQDDVISNTVHSRTLYTAATTGPRDLTLVYKAVGTTTANFVSRRIIVEE
jgi:hypothetical protein